MKFLIFKDKSGEWRWRLKAENGRIIADSGDGYKKRADCENGIRLVKESSGAEVRVDGA